MQKKYLHLYEFQSVFDLGAILYPVIELIYRGHTHFTMVLTGGICALLIHIINRSCRNKNRFVRCLLGAVAVTATELLAGFIVNILLKWNVWDYSGMKFNLLGQICPQFTIYWFFLAIPAIKISDVIITLFDGI